MMQTQLLNQTDAPVFAQEVQRMMAEPDASLSVLIINMNDISQILDRSGQEAGASFLRGVAKLLVRVCRENDKVFRIGDSTFAIVLSGVTSSVHQTLAAEKIVRLHDAAIREMDAPFQAAIFIGIASYPGDSNDVDDLIHKAKIAVEAARSNNEPYFIYSSESVKTMSAKWGMQEELGAAIDNKALELHYQPRISASTGRAVGAEALLRWTNLKGELVSPEVFIPVAIDIGMMDQLTRFVLTTALRQASEWPDTGERKNLSVNLETQSLKDSDISDVISSSLSIWGSDNCDLTLEITEGALIDDSHSNFQLLNEIRSMGVGISIDDFGTGYSSLSHFRNIPATELKIDQSFVANMLESDQDRYLVETIIWLAHRFDLTVVAEGVESTEQLNLLTELNCDTIQGYLFSKPLPHEDFCRWLGSN
jgi:diguanylate cyclase (GGDEF)-like protein